MKIFFTIKIFTIFAIYKSIYRIGYAGEKKEKHICKIHDI